MNAAVENGESKRIKPQSLKNELFLIVKISLLNIIIHTSK